MNGAAAAALLLLAAYGAPLGAQERAPAISVVVKELSSGNKIVLIGAESPTPTHFDPASAGFSADGRDFSHFLPRYMITLSADAVQKIYSFDLKGRDEATLPKVILDAQKMKKQFARSEGAKGARFVISEFAKGTGLDAASKALGFFGGALSKEQRKQGQELTSLVESENSGLADALSKSQLADLDSSLRLRFNPSPYRAEGGLLLGPDKAKQEELTELKRNEDRDQSEGQLGNVVELANRNRLRAVRISRSAVMLELDCRQVPGRAQWDARGADLNRKGLADLCKGTEEFAPLALYNLDQAKEYVQVVDFADPSKLRDKDLAVKIHDLSLQAASFLFPASSLSMRAGDAVLTDALQRRGSKVFMDRSGAQAEIEIEAQTGELTAGPRSEALAGSLVRNLKGVNGLSAADRTRLEQGLVSADAVVRDRAFAETIQRIAEHQDGIRGFSGGDRAAQSAARSREKSWKSFAEWMNDPANLSELDQDLKKKNAKTLEAEARRKQGVERAAAQAAAKTQVLDERAATAAASSAACDPNAKSTIVLMIDGLRPDRLKRAADKGLIPTIQARVLSHAAEFESYATNTVSMSAWTTDLSGEPEDKHGVTGASPSSRDRHVEDEDYIDFRQDYHLFSIPKKGGTRVYKQLRETGGDIYPSELSRDQIYQSYAPLHDGVKLPLVGIGAQGREELSQEVLGALNPYNFVDLGVASDTVRAIRKDPCRYRLVRDYFISIDDDGHEKNYSIDHSFRVVDQAVKKVLEATDRDPVLKNARIILVSDHGMAGGMEYPDPLRRTLPDRSFFVNNTSFNLQKFFAGDYPDKSADYDYVVGSNGPEEEKPGGLVSFPRRVPFRQKSFTYRGVHHNPGKPGYRGHRTLQVEPYGNNMAHVYVLDDAKRDPAIRKNYYELTHSRSQAGKPLNLVDDLLNYRLPNADVDGDPIVRKALEENTGRRPVGLFAMGLQGEAARKSADRLGSAAGAGPSDRDPVLVRAAGGKAALVYTRVRTLEHEGDLSREELTNEERALLRAGKPVTVTEFRYVVLKDFDQKPSGEIVGTVSKDLKDDPLDHQTALDPAQWRSEKATLNRTHLDPNPAAIIMLARNFTLQPETAAKPFYTGKIPDFMLFSNEFYDFNTFQAHEGDHGALSRNQARNTLIVTDPDCQGTVLAKEPVLSRQLADTIEQSVGGVEQSRHGEGLLGQVLSTCASTSNHLKKAPAGASPDDASPQKSLAFPAY